MLPSGRRGGIKLDEKKKKQYIIFGIIAAIVFIVIIAVPAPNNKSKVAIPPSVSPGARNVVIPFENSQEQPNENVEMEEVVLEEYFNRIVKRDIFLNPILASDKGKNTNENQSIAQEKPVKVIKVTGVMITSKKKSVTLDDGRIFYEKDIVDDYIVSKVEREEVLFISRYGKDSQRVKVWGDGE